MLTERILEESHVKEPEDDDNDDDGNGSKENGESVHGKEIVKRIESMWSRCRRANQRRWMDWFGQSLTWNEKSAGRVEE